MSMSPDEILKLHLGNLMVQVITLQAENQSLKEELAKSNVAAASPAPIAAV